MGVSQPIVTSPDDLDEERRQRRRIPELAIGLVLVLVGALTSLWLFASLSESTEIVQSARMIRRGETITISHLQALRIGVDGSDRFIPRDSVSELIGKVATVDLAAGTPLTMSMVDERPQLASGEALASVALDPGQFPPDLAVGDVVAVALVPDIVVAEARPPRLFESPVTVWSIEQPEGLFGAAIVTLRTTTDLAVEIAGSGGVHLAVVMP